MIPGSVALRQFHNPANPLAHYETTGPEIYRDLDGQINYLVAGAGSGGTYSGVMRYLKEPFPRRGDLRFSVGAGSIQRQLKSKFPLLLMHLCRYQSVRESAPDHAVNTLLLPAYSKAILPAVLSQSSQDTLVTVRKTKSFEDNQRHNDVLL